MKVFKFGAYTKARYGNQLIEIKLIAEDKKLATEMMRDILENSTCVDTDEGFFLNDEYDYS